MKVLLVIFGLILMVLGGLTSMMGFMSMASDIQMIIGFVGINMFGIGIGLVGIAKAIGQTASN